MTEGQPDIVDAQGIADRLGVKRKTVHTWRFRGIFPEPDWTLNSGPVWEWGNVEAWAKETGRLTPRQERNPV